MTAVSLSVVLDEEQKQNLSLFIDPVTKFFEVSNRNTYKPVLMQGRNVRTIFKLLLRLHKTSRNT